MKNSSVGISPKERLQDRQFFLLFNGPSCGGKSTVSDIIFERYGGIYKAKGDVIKWLISDYQPNEHRRIVHLMTMETLRIALAQGLSVMKEGGSWEPEAYAELSKAANVPLVVVNIEAPWEVLLSRFEKRIEAKKQGMQISNTDPKRFKEIYDRYLSTKVKSELEFDSSKETPEQIVEQIVFYMRSQSI